MIIIETYSCVFALHEPKSNILELIKSKMASIVPNLLAIVGSQIVVELVGKIFELVNMYACSLQNLGAKKPKDLVGYSFDTTCCFGVIFESQIVQTNALQRSIQLVAQKCSLADKFDYMQGDVTFGKTLVIEAKK